MEDKKRASDKVYVTQWKESNLPGTKFTIKLKASHFGLGDIVEPYHAKIIKAPKFNWWRRLLVKLGFSYKYQIEIIKDDGK